DLREWANTRARIASSAHSEDMNTIAQLLMVAKATDPETDIVDPTAIDISSVMPTQSPRYSSDI
ncbi:MAG: hypothetical protein JWN14_2284, partial [Chthonomonadales bacterium]|nr:hypothetical protein [Chthonomonadales bacterium]